ELLIIDDLGTELVNSFTTTQLFNCINERLLADKSTIISSNLSLEQLQNNYSERIFSRLVNRYTIIKLFGKDIRMIKKLEG
ncbi:MAG: ATP-binding protein, partial [Lachnospiraceae bacterium]|nr:ATP-binding protein [Lachnospiraceae bacterium]